MKKLHWLTVNLCIMAFLLGCEETETASFNKREIQPPKGQGASKQICTVIRNYAPFSVTGRVQLKSRERVLDYLKMKVGKFAFQERCTVWIQSHSY